MNRMGLPMNGVIYVGLNVLLCKALAAALPAQVGMHVYVDDTSAVSHVR